MQEVRDSMKILRTVAAALVMLMASQAVGFAAEAKPAAKEPLPVIEGVVVDGHGKPIPGAQVFGISYVSGDSGWRKSPRMSVPVTKSGRFVFKPKVRADSGLYVVVATAKGFACGSGLYRPGVRGARQELKIVLKPGYTLKGKVVDESGKPVSGAKVEVLSCYGWSSAAPTDQIPGNIGGLLESATGKDGRFEISRLLRPSDYDDYSVSLNVSKKGRATIETGFSNDGRDQLAGTVTIKQPSGCRVEGVLLLPDRKTPAPAGTSVAALVDAKYGWQPRTCDTDKSGKFRFDALPPGKVIFLLAPRVPRIRGQMPPGKQPDWVLPAVTRDLKPKEVARLQLFAETGALVKGKVAAKTGEPAGQASVVILDRCAPGSRYSSWHMTSTNDKGEFTVRVAAGKVTVAVEQWERNWYSEDRPAAEFAAEDGQDKTDVAIVVEPTANVSPFDYEKASKEIPVDFELRPGAYELTWDPNADCAEAFKSYSELASDKIKGYLKGLPKLASSKAEYYACPLDGSGKDGCIAIVADESKGTGKGFDTAYVDANRNWDLSDDKPITFKTPMNYRRLYTDEFSVPLRQRNDDGEIAERLIQARLSIYGNGSDYFQAQLVTKGAWKGTVDSNKGKVECMVVDTSCDGVCGSVTAIDDDGSYTSEGDRVFIDTNGAGSVISYPYGSHGVMLYKVAKVGSRFYSISASKMGDRMIIAPYTGPMGKLLVKGTSIQGAKAVTGAMSITGGPGSYDINRTGEKEVLLPVGKYRIGTCSLSLPSSATPIPLSCTVDTPVEVKPDATATVSIGGKLALAIDPSVKNLVWKPGQTETLEWVIKIGDNASFSSLGQSSASPRVKFFNAKGKLVHSCKAGYT